MLRIMHFQASGFCDCDHCSMVRRVGSETISRRTQEYSFALQSLVSEAQTPRAHAPSREMESADMSFPARRCSSMLFWGLRLFIRGARPHPSPRAGTNSSDDTEGREHQHRRKAVSWYIHNTTLLLRSTMGAQCRFLRTTFGLCRLTVGAEAMCTACAPTKPLRCLTCAS